MIILGIETSCDETSAALVENGRKILSNVIATSVEMHIKTGGIIPEQAARQQIKSIIPVIQESLSKVLSKNASPNLDAVAVTVGPGLIGSLLVGTETAKTLSFLWKRPIIPVNHLVGHLYANWLDEKLNTPEFPALALVVSGGHTDLVLMKNHGKLKWIGGTRDDAAGEAFDKTARLLDLPYPGGPSISKAAEIFFSQQKNKENKKLVYFPRPLINEGNFDWSFSGLKTAVLREVKDKKLGSKEKQKLAAEIQEAIVDSLITKTLKAIQIYKPKSLLLAGGVAANKRLREKFSEKLITDKLKLDFYAAKPNLCTDNAASIASCAFYNYKPVDWKSITTNPQLTITGEI